MSGLSRKENGWWRGAVALTDLSTTRLRFWLVLTTVTWCQLPSETLRSANRVTLVWRQLTGKEARYSLQLNYQHGLRATHNLFGKTCSDLPDSWFSAERENRTAPSPSSSDRVGTLNIQLRLSSSADVWSLSPPSVAAVRALDRLTFNPKVTFCLSSSGMLEISFKITIWNS